MLVVANDPLANQAIIAASRPAQLSVFSTEDAIVAWQWINSEGFDLVVLDIDMPVLDGLQLCRLLRELPGHEKTSVLLVTPQDDPDTRSTAAASGADDLIAKPILAQELAAKMVMHLVKKQLKV